jgi:hypothetical protein
VSAADLYEALADLIEDICAEVRVGDLGRVQELATRREELLGRIGGLRPPTGSRSPDDETSMRERSVAALVRVVERDRELLRLLEAEQAGTVEALAEVDRGRRLLQSYRGSLAESPAYVDRLG